MPVTSVVKGLLPRPLRAPARAFYHRLYRACLRLRCLYLDVLDRRSGLPPAQLRFRVGETTDAAVFLDVGRRTASGLESALRQAGRPLETCTSILDFGCGCGRTLFWLTKQFPERTFYGADVDSESIRWCQAHFPGARFTANGPLPPLPYPEASFDLVYGISVLTHWSEEHLGAWLPELKRIVRPGGVLLLTVHGAHVWRKLCPEEVERNGVVFVTSPKLRGILPDWYQTAFHSPDYLRETFSRHFAAVSYLPEAFGAQDAIVAIR